MKKAPAYSRITKTPIKKTAPAVSKVVPKKAVKAFSRVTKKPLPKGWHSDAWNAKHGFMP